MNSGQIRMGDAYISLGVQDNTGKGLEEAAAGLSRTGHSVLSVTARIGALWSAVAGAVALSVYQTGRYESSLLRIKMVYGVLEQAQRDWMDRFKTLSMRGKLQIADMISTFGAFTKGLGFANDESMILARGLALVSSNMSTFAGIPLEESAQRFRSAMAGSSEVLDMLGINIKEAALNQELLAMGFPSISNGAAESQKVLARYSIILKSMRKQGSLFADATMNTMPRSIEIFKGSVSDFLVTAGAPFMEFAMNLIQLFTTIMTLATRVSKSFKYISTALGPAAAMITVLIGSLSVLAGALIFTGALFSNYNRLLELNISLAGTAAGANTSLALSILKIGTKFAGIAAAVAGVVALIAELAYGLDEASDKVGFMSMAFDNLWFNLKQGNWGDSLVSLYDMVVLVFRQIMEAVDSVISNLMNNLVGNIKTALLEVDIFMNRIARKTETTFNSAMGFLSPFNKDDVDKYTAKIDAARKAIKDLKEGKDTIDIGFFRPPAEDNKALREARRKIMEANQKVKEDRKRMAEEELARQEENLKSMMAKYKNMTGSLKSAALQAPQALTYRSVEGQRAAYQNQLGMLDRLSKLVEVNQQTEDNTRKTNFELQQLRGQLQSVQ